MHKISNNQELEKIYNDGIGFVFNDFTDNMKSGIQYNKLHKAKCYHMNPDNPKRLEVEGDKTGKKHSKYFFDTYEDANIWLQENRSGIGYSNCRHCLLKL